MAARRETAGALGFMRRHGREPVFEIIVVCLQRVLSTAVQLQVVHFVRQCEADGAHAEQQRQSLKPAFGRLSNIKLTGWYILNCGWQWAGE